ncbi:MAG: phosphomannomutase/phosphoglucomutase [Candidatus Shapirobacteria bacterium]|nr:phosphomannomutase/phosphoglucomutase [Candidatus Shapirobacteria bacterium]
MQVNKSIFRGYDIRGIVNQDLNSEIAEHIGRAHGTYLKKRGIFEAVVGYDCRASSKEYSDAFIKGLNWTGIDVINIGLTMVGTFYWAQYYLNRKGGAFITASHNPAEYNGFKLAADFSETLVSDGIQEIYSLVESEDYLAGEKIGNVTFQEINEAYFDDILKRFSNFKSMKVLVDPSCTTAGALVPIILKKAGFEVIEKNCNIDSSFPLGTPDPTESQVAKRISQEVLESGADIGFTYDADGDRIGIVDEKGGIIWNDVLVALFASDVLDHHAGDKIMYNTLCSKVVEDTIIKHGGVPFMWRTGHSFLKKKNQEVKAAFIGELSGHFFFSADFYNHDDGIYSTMRLLDFLSRTNQTLSQAVNSLPKYISSPEIKVGCADDKKVALTEKVSQILKQDYPDAKIIDDERAGDGVRLDMSDSMFVIRYSQNGPYLTIKFESSNQTKYNELKNYIHKLLHSFPEVDWGYGVNVESLD